MLQEALISMLELSRQGERELVAGLAVDERDADGCPESWAARPLLAHITEFKQHQVVRLESILAGEPMPDFPPVDHSDPAVYERYLAQPWDAVLADAERVSAALVARTGELDEAALTGDGANGRALWAQILVRGVWHSSGHIGPYLAQHGRADEAEAQAQRLVDRARDLGLPPTPGSWAMGLYNLACARVAAGRLREGRETLGEAIALDPNFARSAESDPDLEPLRAA